MYLNCPMHKVIEIDLNWLSLVSFKFTFFILLKWVQSHVDDVADWAGLLSGELDESRQNVDVVPPSKISW